MLYRALLLCRHLGVLHDVKFVCKSSYIQEENFLKSVTGSSVIPPLGLDEVKVRATDEDGICAATCVNQTPKVQQ